MPRTDKTLSEQLMNAGWKKLREPSAITTALLCSIPFALLLGAVFISLLYLLQPSLFSFLQDGVIEFTFSLNFSSVLYIIGVFAFMILHEFLHAVLIPNFMKSEKTFWGINGLFGFVFTTEPLKKARFIAISILPFVLLSVILPVILNAFEWLNAYTAFLCFLNAVGSCVDFLNVWLIAFQVPRGQTIISNGFETYYKSAK